jgi:hypothetical protein
MKKLVYEIEPGDRKTFKNIFGIKSSLLKKIILLIPAFAGLILHAPLYYAIHLIIRNRAKDHYDSIVVGILFIFYPIYVLLLTIILFFVKSWYALWLFILLPFFAWSYLQEGVRY